MKTGMTPTGIPQSYLAQHIRAGPNTKKELSNKVTRTNAEVKSTRLLPYSWIAHHTYRPHSSGQPRSIKHNSLSLTTDTTVQGRLNKHHIEQTTAVTKVFHLQEKGSAKGHSKRQQILASQLIYKKAIFRLVLQYIQRSSS